MELSDNAKVVLRSLRLTAIIDGVFPFYTPNCEEGKIIASELVQAGKFKKIKRNFRGVINRDYNNYELNVLY